MDQSSSTDSEQPNPRATDNEPIANVPDTSSIDKDRKTPEKQQIAKHFASRTESLDAKLDSTVTMMADGTFRTANNAIVEPSSWKNKHTWYAHLYRKLHRRYLRITLRWPSWVPRAVGVGVLLVIVLNVVVLSLYVSQKKPTLQRGDSLPMAGIIPADGSKYYVEDAGWQYSGAPTGWDVQDLSNNSGKEYVSSDVTCVVQVVERETQPQSSQLELVASQNMDTYASPIAQARAQVTLPVITVKAARGEQKFEFIRSRYSFNNAEGARVVEISSRTLGKEAFSIIQQCNQSDWGQSQSTRDQLLENLAITGS